jgi:hypothetical protein
MIQTIRAWWAARRKARFLRRIRAEMERWGYDGSNIADDVLLDSILALWRTARKFGTTSSQAHACLDRLIGLSNLDSPEGGP